MQFQQPELLVCPKCTHVGASVKYLPRRTRYYEDERLRVWCSNCGYEREMQPASEEVEFQPATFTASVLD